jgi:steroid delta-isomerase
MSAEHESMEAQCQRWIRLFSELDRVGVPTLDQLSVVAVKDVRFSDPFNDVRGLLAMQRVLEHTRSHVSDVRFSVHDTAWSNSTAYVRWSMTGRVRVIGKWRVQGVSEISFADDGRVSCHIDHWDAASQFFGRLPVIGWLLRRLAAPARVS